MLNNSLDRLRVELIEEFENNIESLFDLSYDSFYRKYSSHRRLNRSQMVVMFMGNLRRLGIYREYRTGREYLYMAIPNLNIPYVDPILPMRIGPNRENEESRYVMDFLDYFSLWDRINQLLDDIYSRLARSAHHEKIEQGSSDLSTDLLAIRSLYNRVTESTLQQIQTRMIFNGDAELISLAHVAEKNINVIVRDPTDLWMTVQSSTRPLRIYVYNNFNLQSMKELMSMVLSILRDSSSPITFYIASFKDIDTELYTIVSRSKYVKSVERLESDLIMFELSRLEPSQTCSIIN